MVVVTWLMLAVLAAGITATAAAARMPRSWREWLGPLGVLAFTLLACSLRLHVAPLHHAMYLDEPWYQEAAKNVLSGRGLVTCEFDGVRDICIPYEKSAGWPALLSLAFAVGGVRDSTALETSLLLGVLATPAAAFALRAAGGTWAQALLAALILAVHPLHVVWSATAETNVAAVTFLLLGLGGVLACLQQPSVVWALVGAGGLGVAAAIRPELWLAFLPALVLVWMRERRSAQVLAMGAGLAFLPGLASREAFLVHNRGALFAWRSIGENAGQWAGATHEGGLLSAALVLVAAVLGVAQLLGTRQRPSLLLAATSTGLAAFVLVYYPPAGFCARTMLGAVAPAALALALALRPRWLLALAAGAVVALWPWREDIAQHIPETQRIETQLPDMVNDLRLPAGSLVLAEWPTVLGANTDLRVMSIARALRGGGDALDRLAKQRPLFLACDMFCEPGFGGSEVPPACPHLLRDFDLEPLRTVGGPHRNYGLFRILGRSAAPIDRPICPVVH